MTTSGDHRSRRRQAAAIVALCAAAIAVVGIVRGSTGRGSSVDVGIAQRTRHDPVFLPAAGWHTTHTHDAHVPQAPAATASTRAVRDPPGSSPSRTLQGLAPSGVIEQAFVYGRPRTGSIPGFPTRTLPLRLAQGTYQSGWEGDARRGDSRIVIVGRRRGLEFEVDVYFAVVHPGGHLRAVAQRELGRLRLPGR